MKTAVCGFVPKELREESGVDLYQRSYVKTAVCGFVPKELREDSSVWICTKGVT